jgi:hypothetical protein
VHQQTFALLGKQGVDSSSYETKREQQEKGRRKQHA